MTKKYLKDHIDLTYVFLYVIKLIEKNKYILGVLSFAKNIEI